MGEAIRVAALYTLPFSSPYLVIDGVDCWPKRRNALLYQGPWPVIAHPPCAPWSRAVAHQLIPSLAQHPVLAKTAVLQVRRFRGILEQPARSRLWDVMSLPYPSGHHAKAVAGPLVDAWGGWTIETDQHRFGHTQIKKTWLYMVGIDPEAVELPAPVDRPTENHGRIRIDSRSGRNWRRRSAVDLCPEGRKRTPQAFAEWLVELAAGLPQGFVKKG